MLSLGQALLYEELHPCWLTLMPKQVDLSMLFPEPSVSDGHPVASMPVFLSGEKRQAVYTSTPIPPVKTVEKVNKECNHFQLQSYLYVTFICIIQQSSHHQGPTIPLTSAKILMMLQCLS